MQRKDDWQGWLIGFSLVLIAILGSFIYRFEDKPQPVYAVKPDNEYCAPDENTLKFLSKDIYINGKHINNWEVFCPVTEYNGRYYICSDEITRECLGFEVKVNVEEETFLLKETEPSFQGASVGGIGCNLSDRPVTTIRDMRVMETSDLSIFDGQTKSQREVEEQDADRIEKYLEKFPWLSVFGLEKKEKLKTIHERSTCFAYGDNYYFPLDWAMEAFGWTWCCDQVSGLYISTEEERSAEEWLALNANNASFVEGRVQYILNRNPKLPLERALYYEYCFRHESQVYGLEELFLMAVCRGEGGFREDVVGGGAIGLMQIMPGTGARQGYSAEDLLDPHKNIECGAQHISNLARSYGGNMIITMSAYNQGSGTIATGLYKTDYAERILLHEQNIYDYIASRGYSMEFFSEIAEETY